ncbi:arginine--tRNA ligase [Gammaproteobacteria bacterium]|nr:arginine--tRNA ligase [Gammaproteobacteria bacterium]
MRFHSNGVQSESLSCYQKFTVPVQNIKQYLNKEISTALRECSGVQSSNANVMTSSRPEFGDYQANGIMPAAKQLRTNPRELALQVIDYLNDNSIKLIENLEVAGPGFINIRLRDRSLLSRANDLLSGKSKAIPLTENPIKVVVDYSSPNLAKEMHVGHLRGTIIGDSIVRVLEKEGHEVIRQNHVGDWGTQFGMLISFMQEIKRSDTEKIPKELSDLEKFYTAAKDRFDSDESFSASSRQAVVKLQSGDRNHRAIWEEFIETSLLHCDAIYKKLNVTLSRTDLDAESRYNDSLKSIVQGLEKKGLVKESDGAKCVFLPEFIGKDGGELPIIIQKSDGGYLYSTTDLAAIELRSEQMMADRALYVVDARQSLHFKQVFALAKSAEIANSSISLEHIAYGTMMGADGRPFRTRSGDTVKLIDLLDESIARAYDLVTEKNPSLDETERRKISETVGIGSVKYAELSKSRTSDYVFEWSSMLSFEGNTAPYLLYAFARINSLLSKEPEFNNSMVVSLISVSEERNLLIKVLQFPEIVNTVSADCYPNLLCNYLFELAGIFMRFYEACPILKADKPIKSSRIALASLTAATLKEGLDLLGIETLEKM